MKHLGLLILSLCAITFGAYAQAPSADEGIQARLWLVRGPITEFKANWGRKDAPEIKEIREAKLGEELTAVVFFQGQSLDSKSQAKVTYTITVKTPDGQKFDNKDMIGIDGPMPKEATKDLYMGAATMKSTLPTNSPIFKPGKYTYTAVVNDLVGKRQTTSEIVVEFK